MTFVQRYTAPLFSWIPDVSAIPPRRMVTIGVVVSLLLHLLAFLIFGLLGLFSDHKMDFARDNAKPKEIELTVIPPDEPPAPAFTIVPTQQRLFMDSRGLDVAKEAADKPLFESDENMKAASEVAATGDLPLPGQDGRNSPFNEFKTQRSLLGPVAQPFTLDTPPSPPVPQTPPAPPIAMQTPATAPDTTPPPPVPKPAEKVEKATKPEDKPATKTPDNPQPTKLRAVEKPREDEIALSKTQSIPEAITEILKPVATPPPVSVSHAAVLRPLDDQMAKLTTPMPKPMPVPQPPHPSGYQPETEKNHIESSISNRGRSAVNAIGTPMGRWRKQVHDAIGSRWLYYVDSRRDLLAFGVVSISFSINDQGKVAKVHVEANTGNQSLESVTLEAIHDAEISPPPLDPASPIGQEPLDWKIDFTYYPIR
jgi:outer membrane biosynthesis protein TonB